MATIDEISKDVYRISAAAGGPMGASGFTFNQFLIKDQNITLIHTGSAESFNDTVEAISKVVDPKQIRYIFMSHFESDEGGALGKFLALAPNATAVCSRVGARQLSGFDICSNAQGMQPGDTLDLGSHKLRFLAYPSEPHLWEGLLAYDESARILFSADLFVKRGAAEGPVVKASREEALAVAKQSIPSDEGREKCQAEVNALAIDLVAVGHGPALDLRS